MITYPGRADNDDFIKFLFEGGSAENYGCSDVESCLRINKKIYNIFLGGFGTKVNKMLTSISNKALSETNH